MKLRKILMMLICVSFVMASAGSLFAGDTINLTGVVEKTDSGIVLMTGDADYALAGEAVVEELVGKKVEVTGMVEENETGKILQVISVKEIASEG